MKKDEYKKEYIDRIKNNKEKNFDIEKVELSNDHPILQSVRKIDTDEDYIIKRAQDFLNAPPDPNFGYKGRKTHTVIKYVESPGKFFGIKIGRRIRIGVWVEVERVRDE